MKQKIALFAVVAVLSTLSVLHADAQVNWNVGGEMGLSIYDGSAGFHIGPMAEVVFGKGLCVGSEFNLNTQTGTPIEWANYFKYLISVSGSKVKPYVDGGLELFFYTGGPYFGIRFGGGAMIPIANKLYVAPDIQFGPVFVTGSTVFAVLIRGGIRYEI